MSWYLSRIRYNKAWLRRQKQYHQREGSAQGKGGAGKKHSKRLSGLSQSQADTVLETAQVPYKGSTKAGHALSKHAGRFPETWGKLFGPQRDWNKQAMKHVNEFISGPGKFKETTTNKGITFLEKRLEDGRGIRLNRDFTFKGFID